MTNSQQDLPLRPIAEQIRRRDFGTVRRGYDRDEVRAYLNKLARQVGDLERELGRLRREAASATSGELTTGPERSQASPTEDPYEALSKRFAALIEMADQEAEKILSDARSEASRTLSQAASDAHRIRVDAQSHAEETRHEAAELRERATTESDRVLSGLAERRRSLVNQMEEMRAKLLAVAEDFAVSVDGAVRIDANETELVSTSSDHEADDRAEDSDAGTSEETRFEDLWAKKDEPLQVPDLATLEQGFEERNK